MYLTTDYKLVPTNMLTGFLQLAIYTYKYFSKFRYPLYYLFTILFSTLVLYGLSFLKKFVAFYAVTIIIIKAYNI